MKRFGAVGGGVVERLKNIILSKQSTFHLEYTRPMITLKSWFKRFEDCPLTKVEDAMTILNGSFRTKVLVLRVLVLSLLFSSSTVILATFQH